VEPAEPLLECMQATAEQARSFIEANRELRLVLTLFGVGLDAQREQQKVLEKRAFSPPVADESSRRLDALHSQGPLYRFDRGTRPGANAPDLDLDHPWALQPSETIEGAALRTGRSGTRCERHAIQECLGELPPAHCSHRQFARVSHRLLRHHALNRLRTHRRAGRSDATRRVVHDGARCVRVRSSRVRRHHRCTARGRSPRRAQGLHATRPGVVLPEIARGLFGHFVAAIQGVSQYRKWPHCLK
jgi:hypothetical protein